MDTIQDVESSRLVDLVGFRLETGDSEVNHNKKPQDLVVTVNTEGQSNWNTQFPVTTSPVDGVKLTKAEEAEACGGASHAGDGDRETWGKKVDFLLSIIGFAVDLANVWRFPYLCYRNGGGAFLIPYFLMLIFGAIPLFFMELVLGQFHRDGAIAVWKIVPLFQGIGVCQCLIAYFVAFYYNVIIAWSLFYLVSSFTVNLPWMTCNNPWNTDRCSNGPNITVIDNVTVTVTSNYSVSSAAEYYERAVLGLHESEGMHDVGSPRWQLSLCLLGVFLMLYFTLWKGVKSSGKVVWVTATMPYVVLTILMIRGLTLPGAGTGILYYITPDIKRLADSQVWIDAAIQVFYSAGSGFGVHIAYASYNKFTNNCYRDCILTACINSFTSLFSGFVIFSYLGYMALKQNTTIENVATEGPGLVFVVYPEAIATLPGSVGWAIIFFVMLLTLGLDSAMGGLEAALTGFGDLIRPTKIGKMKYWREIFTGLVVGSAGMFALQNVTNGGAYLFHMWDTFAAGTAILFGVFSQAVAVSWFYGIDQLCADIQRMLGFRPSFYWRICWKFITPVFLFTIIVSSVVSYVPLEFETYTGGIYVYPSWANGVGWTIAASSMICIPAVALYKMLTTEGTITERFALNISPVWEHRSIKQGCKVSRLQRKHWLSV
ncbi:hypothetical protein CAPTEDRAFT_176318 [Capitella teleta]|uniref:Transporter n=1 Tax=Capitella teleta TaxID=283909 RepID=R7TSR3_CAPTE|nr:hypothetical protein CAPTEDRAFT_176318 [Capitella teleta]|eukprot:ELT96928.1 hypothetical protein CAPTEDRAFT_176318 [Capitella teleta]